MDACNMKLLQFNGATEPEKNKNKNKRKLKKRRQIIVSKEPYDHQNQERDQIRTANPKTNSTSNSKEIKRKSIKMFQKFRAIFSI